MSSTNKNLFGDDDDSSDEDESPTKEKETEKPKDSASEAEIGQDSNNNDNNNDNNKTPAEAAPPARQDKEEEKEEEATKKPSTSRGLFADSDDDDDDGDDDVEFDDKGAVVGASLPEGQKPKPPPPPPRREDDENDDDGMASPMDVDVDDTASPSNALKQQAQAPKLDNRPLTLPEATRLGESNETSNGNDEKQNISLHMTKLPNLIGIQVSAFDPNNYHPKLEEEDFGPSAVHNLIRWRYLRDSTGHIQRDAHDKLQRESNTRLVEWEDGTWTLHIGTETFDVDTTDSSAQDGFAALNGYMHLSQPATVSEDPTNTEEDGKPAGTVLECFGNIASRMTARPSSLQSEAHKSLTVAVRQRTIKKARIAEIATAEDPEKLKQERIRLRNELEKASKKKASSSSSKKANMSAGYLEGDYDDFNVGRAKQASQNFEDEEDDGYPNYGGADEEEEDDLAADNTFNAQRPSKRGRKERKARQQEAEEEDEDDVVVGGGAEEDDDDEEEDAPFVKKKSGSKKKPAHRAVFADDDESE